MVWPTDPPGYDGLTEINGALMAKRNRQRRTTYPQKSATRPESRPDVAAPAGNEIASVRAETRVQPQARRSKPIDHSIAASAEAGRRTQRRRENIRLAVIGTVLVAPLLAIIVGGGILQPQLGIEASSEGGIGSHVAQDAVLTHRNRPPSSGVHYPSAAAYRASVDPIAPGNWIHNLEHGAIVVLYRCADRDSCSAAAGQLQREVIGVAAPARFGEVKIVGTPFADLDSAFTAVAWGRTLPLDRFDATQILAFYDRYVGRGPENAP